MIYSIGSINVLCNMHYVFCSGFIRSALQLRLKYYLNYSFKKQIYYIVFVGIVAI